MTLLRFDDVFYHKRYKKHFIDIFMALVNRSDETGDMTVIWKVLLNMIFF